MADHARSDDPAVQKQLDRFAQLSPGRDILGLERITELLAAIGNPHRNLPPVFHVAGTNGKGSTCAFLRAMLEAAGHRVHVYTSPHLVRFNERIRIAGKLIDDTALAALLAEILDAAEANDIGPSFFEATTAAAFLAFARTPADACVIEVGLGGRLDATNVIEKPLVCGIAQLGIDHEAFLLAPEEGTPDEPMERIAFEKAGIAKSGVPLVTMAYESGPAKAVEAVATRVGAPIIRRGRDWEIITYNDRFYFRDDAGQFAMPMPRMHGRHQLENAGLAIAMLRNQSALRVSERAFAAAMQWTEWPARMQRLAAGPLTAPLPHGSTVWLDGGHNPAAAIALADALPGAVHVIVGMLRNKDAMGFFRPLASRIETAHAVPIPGHEHHDPKDLCHWLQSSCGITFADPVDNVGVALRRIAEREREPVEVLICGSLYLAGEVLRSNDQMPE